LVYNKMVLKFAREGHQVIIGDRAGYNDFHKICPF
jgi:hypothetical protein